MKTHPQGTGEPPGAIQCEQKDQSRALEKSLQEEGGGWVGGASKRVFL